MKLEKQNRRLKEQQELYQISLQPVKCLSEIGEKQLRRAQEEGNTLKKLLPPLQAAVAQTTSEISALQTTLQKLNDILLQDEDKVTSVKKSASSRDSITSEVSIQVEYTSEVNRWKNSETATTTTDWQPKESTRVRQPALETTETTTHEKPIAKRRSKSDSAGTGLGIHRVISDAPKPTQVDISDPQLRSALQKRWKHVEATSSSQ